MKTKFNLFLLGLLLPSIALCQPLTKQQVQEDYRILKNVLTKGHPALYEYTTSSQWDSLFAHFESKQLNTILSTHDFYKSITELTDYARDGHLIAMRPQLDTIPKLFPLLVKIIDGKLYTDTDDFGISVGSEIISVNGVNGAELRKRFMKYAPADGFNTSKKDRQIEREFGILHFYEFGVKSTYKVAYKTLSNEVMTKTIESQSFESIGKRFAKRNSHIAHKTLGKKAPFLHFIDSLHTAVLTINTFHQNIEEYQAKLKSIFKEIRQKKSHHLIIDIRQNEGGYPLNAIKTFSYLTNERFKQRSSSEVVTSRLPEQRYGKNLVNNYTYETFFKKYYQGAERTENRWILDIDENEPLMVPNKKRYQGKVYVLIGGNTFSAGSSFALFCKNTGITLVGEETGGGYYTQTGGYPILYTLPNSGIKILLSFVKINRFVKDKTVKKGSGILPDEKVPYSIEDLIQTRDPQLNHVLKLIKKLR